MPRRRPEDHLTLHASALFGAISIALTSLGCQGETQATPGPSPSAATAPSAQPTAAATEPTATPTPAQDTPSPAVPSGTPSASATAVASATAAVSATAVALSAPSASATANPKALQPKKPTRPSYRTVEGRPFLVDDVARVASLAPGPDWAEPLDLAGASPDPAQREALVHHYTRWSLAEHASIASFARFTLHLLSFGAPPHLVARATEAMSDETRHARLGFSLVAALSSTPLRPTELPIEGALPALPLEDALRLTVREGIIGETLAALEARLAAEMVSIPPLKAPLKSLAADESRHAELAFSFAAWAISRAPELARIIQEEIEDWQPPPLEAVSGLEPWGVLDTATRRAVHREGLALVIHPLARRLAAASPSALAHPPLSV